MNKERILQFLEDRPVPQSLAAICERFKLQKKDVLSLLDEMVEDGEIYKTKKEKYTSLKNAGVTRGRAIVRSGAPVFVCPDDGSKDLFMGDADWVMNGDIVLVQITDNGDRPRCSLIRIVKRAVSQFPAVIEIETHAARQKKKQKQPVKAHITALAYPLDSRIPGPIRLRTKSAENAASGDIAMIRIVKYPERNQEALAEIVEVFGREEDLEAVTQSILASHEIPREFSDEVLQAANQMPRRIGEADLAGREDLRGWTTFTIDGADAKDYDDAVSLIRLDDGWQLGVHIADVSHYVKEREGIDRAALERGTSVYLPGLTIPMLPDVLCNDLCSLLPQTDRLTLSAIVQLTDDGALKEYRIVESVIHSSARLTYEQVNEMLAGKTDHAVPDSLCPILRDMNMLKDRIANHRKQRGSIDLDLPEAKIEVGAHMVPTTIELRERGESERMIEQFMLTANECVAEFGRMLELPFLYRVHEAPDAERLQRVNEQLATIGCGLRLGSTPKPREISALLDAIAENPSAEDIRHSLLFAMSKARYADTPDGHYALAADDYCHFTSPIRRYPDLFIHRMIKRHFKGKAPARIDTDGLGQHCTQREIAAALAEREADKMLMAAYMARHIGKRFDARVSRIGKNAIFVALPNTIEGVLTPYYMRDRFVVDEQRRSATFIPSGTTVNLGDTIRVRVENAIPVTGEIEFSFVENH